jgi:hypothetical protein
MSATTELITEQIIQLKSKIETARKNGEDVTSLLSQHETLMRQLSAASQALNENKQILKG